MGGCTPSTQTSFYRKLSQVLLLTQDTVPGHTNRQRKWNQKGQNVFEKTAEMLLNRYLSTDLKKKVKACSASLYDYGAWICCKHSICTFTSKFHLSIQWWERTKNTWIAGCSHSTHRQAIVFPAFSFVRRGTNSRIWIRLTFHVGQVSNHLHW